MDEAKSIRDKAEAARKYAKSAALGLQIQNFAAELKLRAERRVGELLAGMVLRGGDRKSKSHDESLTLADLGIDHNQSARWQREASIPESVFEHYIQITNKLGKDITAQALLNLAGKSPASRSVHSRSARPKGQGVGFDHRPVMRGGEGQCRAEPLHTEPGDLSALEIVAELRNHRDLLAKILQPLQTNSICEFETVARRMVERLLADLDRHLCHLYELLKQGTE